MCKIKLNYILNILLLSLLLLTVGACEEGALPEMVSPDSAPRDVRAPSTSLEGLPEIPVFEFNRKNLLEYLDYCDYLNTKRENE